MYTDPFPPKRHLVLDAKEPPSLRNAMKMS